MYVCMYIYIDTHTHTHTYTHTNCRPQGVIVTASAETVPVRSSENSLGELTHVSAETTHEGGAILSYKFVRTTIPIVSRSFRMCAH